MPPTKDNSEPLSNEAEGRGSFVWFNMASMFQSSESGYDTLEQARNAGFPEKMVSDYTETIQQAFQKYSHFVKAPQNMS